ncbi:MAG: DNA-binding response regulator [Nitrospiraceae bacterium]|nr:MAG: DNA-binding response regulator [Nitrospiraceae bacterium]
MKNHKAEEKINGRHKVFLVDDHPIVRQGLAQLINQEPDLVVCGEASDIQSAVQDIQKSSPDIIIVDISLGQESGIRLIEDLLMQEPRLLILVLSMHDESLYAERCLKSGAMGYIMKQEPPEKVIQAIKKVLKGEMYISESLNVKLLQKFTAKKPDIYLSPIERLSNRELEVFQLIGQGLKTRKIAEQLNLSVKTIETYIEHIKRKMDFEDLRNLILHAVQWHMGEHSVKTEKTDIKK